MFEENKKGYKKTKLGWIPEDWAFDELQEFCLKIQDGTHFSPTTIPDGKYKYITSKNIRMGYMDLSNVELISEAEHNEIYKRCDTKVGDILLTKDGASTGNVCMNTLNEEISLLSSVAFIRPKSDKADGNFILQTIMSPVGQRIIKDSMAGQAITRITLSKLKKYKFSFPPLPEQKRIASILSTWDKAISLTKQHIAAKKDQKKGLMQGLLKGKERVKDYTNEWTPFKFKEIYTPKKKKAGEKDYINLSVTLNGIVSQAKYFNKKIASQDTSKYLVVEKGDMVMSGLNFWMGSIDVLEDFEIGIVSPAYKVFQIKNPQINHLFMRYMVRSEIFLKALIGSSVKGASIVRRNLDKEMLEEWVFKIPALDEQKSVAQILNKSDAEINLLHKKLNSLEEQKKGLMQKLLTGKIRVIDYQNN
jgi:type I restriction enzyme S subunit